MCVKDGYVCMQNSELICGQLGKGVLGAGAYTRPLFSSTCAVFDTKYILNTPRNPLTPPTHPPNNPYMHSLSHRKRLR